MRLLIAGGGTGGHLFPALAVAQAFRTKHPDAEVLLVGKRRGPEERVVPEAGFRLETVAIRGFDRDALWKNSVLPVLLPAGLGRGIALLREFAADVVLGVGGYVMVPAVAAARLLGVPYVLHEQNVEPGLATRRFARSAKAICLTFPESGHRLRNSHLVVTGLPLRAGFARREPKVPPEKLLVMGGSQGARHLNHAVWGALDDLRQRFRQVIHVTGAQGATEAAALASPGYRPLSFTANMADLMAEADLVVCRAGVGTISEVAAVGLPAILVPGTFGGGHQELNAEAMVKAGAAVRLGDDDLRPETLLETIDRLDARHLKQMAACSGAWGRPEAAERVVAVLEGVAAGR